MKFTKFLFLAVLVLATLLCATADEPKKNVIGKIKEKLSKIFSKKVKQAAEEVVEETAATPEEPVETVEEDPVAQETENSEAAEEPVAEEATEEKTQDL